MTERGGRQIWHWALHWINQSLIKCAHSSSPWTVVGSSILPLYLANSAMEIHLFNKNFHFSTIGCNVKTHNLPIHLSLLYDDYQIPPYSSQKQLELVVYSFQQCIYGKLSLESIRSSTTKRVYICGQYECCLRVHSCVTTFGITERGPSVAMASCDAVSFKHKWLSNEPISELMLFVSDVL